MNDYNKENLTPRSNSKFSTFFESNFIALKEKSEVLLTEMEKNEYYKQLKSKDEKTFQLVEKDNLIFREKAEEEFLKDMIQEKEKKIKNITEINNMPNVIKRNKLAGTLFNKEVINNTIRVKMLNEISIYAQKDITGEYSTMKVAKEGNDILEQIYQQDPESMLYWAAYNIC
jgi:hypothetical protein